MPNGITAAASALRYWERRQEVVANNLANASTSGFKGERVFAKAVNGALPTAGAVTDRRTGQLESTGRPLDLALATDDTFFVIGTPGGERLSRGGSFSIDANNKLVDAQGNPVLGDKGPITLPQGDVSIDANGTVNVNGQECQRLRLERVPTGTPLVHEGGTRFVPPATRDPIKTDAGVVKQGQVEQSNVNSLDSMVDLIAIQRAYASTQKAITTLDEVHRTAATELGKPV